MVWKMAELGPIAGSTPNDGTHNWTVTRLATTTARIRVNNVGDPAVWDMSDGDFIIE